MNVHTHPWISLGIQSENSGLSERPLSAPWRMAPLIKPRPHLALVTASPAPRFQTLTIEILTPQHPFMPWSLLPGLVSSGLPQTWSSEFCLAFTLTSLQAWRDL